MGLVNRGRLFDTVSQKCKHLKQALETNTSTDCDQREIVICRVAGDKSMLWYFQLTLKVIRKIIGVDSAFEVSQLPALG